MYQVESVGVGTTSLRLGRTTVGDGPAGPLPGLAGQCRPRPGHGMAHRQADGARSCGRRPAALALRRSGRSAASAGHRCSGAAVADSTDFDQIRRRPVACQCGGDGAGRAAAAVARGPRSPSRRKRGCGGGALGGASEAERARGGGDAALAAAAARGKSDRVTGESWSEAPHRWRRHGAVSWRRDVCAIVAAIKRHAARRACPRWGRDPAAGRAIRPGLAQFGTLCFWHAGAAGAGPAGRVLSSVLVRPKAAAAWKFAVNTSSIEYHVNHIEIAKK